MTKLRGAFVALVVLALSAGVALAGHPTPSSASGGLQTAADASGKTVPVVNQAPNTEDENEDTNEDESSEDGTPCGPERDNHGWDVCQAATGETPEGFDNHGDYVSSIAKQNAGQDAVSNHKPSGAGQPSSAGKPSWVPSH